MRRWRIVSKTAIILMRLSREHRIIIDESFNVRKGAEITADVDPSDAASNVEILFDLRNFRVNSDVS